MYKRFGLVTGTAGLAVFAYLCIPGHPLGTFFYDLAPGIARSALAYGQQNSQEFWTEVKNHVLISAAAIGLSFAICFPLGILASRIPAMRALTTNIVGIARGVPGVAVLFLMWPLIGQGAKPALIALTILAAPPVFLNTAAGYANVERSVIEAARGMGMNLSQILMRIETPLAAPVVLAGVRTAAIEVIASATIASYINFDTLGTPISTAIQYLPQSSAEAQLTLGVAAVAAIALMAELSLSVLQKLVSPPSP
ncbi:MAG TPA: ABC transporter permease [Chloroflexota bacterium]|nr:ABC transporter permease [Chloroflexota bacterium]